MPLRCEKPSDSSLLGQGHPDFDTDRRKGQPTLRVQLVSQNNTSQFEAVPVGPRLLPAFVAQVIGQALPDGRDTTVANYRPAAPRMALLLDRVS